MVKPFGRQDCPANASLALGCGPRSPVKVVTVIDGLWFKISNGDVPSPRRALEVPAASFCGPLASSLAVRSAALPPSEKVL